MFSTGTLTPTRYKWLGISRRNLALGGLEMKATQIVIPDLWHVAVNLGLDTLAGQAVLETWHIAHDLRNAAATAGIELATATITHREAD